MRSKDAEIAILKVELLKAQTEGPGTSIVQELRRENAELRTKIATLQEKTIKDNDYANARLTLIVQSFPISLPPHSPSCGLPLFIFCVSHLQSSLNSV